LSFTAAELSGLCLLLFGLFYWLGIFAKFRVFLAVAAVIGLGGFLGRALVVVAGWLQHVTGTITGWLLGVSIPAALFAGLAVVLIHDLHPRHGATRRTSWIAMAVAALLVAGVAGIPALAPLAGALRSLLAAVAGFFNTL
jgi:hypothetical protein